MNHDDLCELERGKPGCACGSRAYTRDDPDVPPEPSQPETDYLVFQPYEPSLFDN